MTHSRSLLTHSRSPLTHDVSAHIVQTSACLYFCMYAHTHTHTHIHIHRGCDAHEHLEWRWPHVNDGAPRFLTTPCPQGFGIGVQRSIYLCLCIYKCISIYVIIWASQSMLLYMHYLCILSVHITLSTYRFHYLCMGCTYR